MIFFALMGFALYLIGCPSNPTQNNQSSNQNNAISSNKAMPSSSTQSCDPNSQIQNLPTEIQKQFTDGTISLNYDPVSKKLTFTGLFYNTKAGRLDQLLTVFNQFRRKGCVEQISFQGKEADGKKEPFQWCSEYKDGKCTALLLNSQSCKIGVAEKFMEDSSFKSQLSHNYLSFKQRDFQTGIFVLSGKTNDLPGSMDFITLLGQFGALMEQGCLSNVPFTPHPSKTTDPNDGFEFGNCAATFCECSGICKTCCGTSGCENPCPGDTNTNVNVNTNKNVNANTNANMQ